MLQKKTSSSHFINFSNNSEKLLSHRLQSHLPLFAKFHSSKELNKYPLYQESDKQIEDILNGCEYGFYNSEPTSILPKKFYRAVFWNLSGKVNFTHLMDTLKSHPILRRADFIIFSHADIGMLRTENRNVVRSLALELSYNYVFATSYLYLDRPGSLKKGKDQFGIAGQAIMTPHPLTGFCTFDLPPVIDPMKRSPKRLGQEKALLVKVEMGLSDINLVSLRLDSGSSPRQRHKQVSHIIQKLNPYLDSPLLIGGGLNTTTYNSRHALTQFFSFLNKVMRGYDYICEKHHTHPEAYFEKRLFELIQNSGFTFHDLNEIGQGTWDSHFEDLEVQGHWEKKISHMMTKTLKKFFYHGPSDHLSLKVDWFLGNQKIKASSQPQAERPKVLSNLFHESLISTHHPIVLDFEIKSEKL